MTTAYPTHPMAGAAPADSATSYARAALAFGVVGAVWLSIILGVTALFQIKSPDEGRGQAIAGLVVSAAWIVVFVAAARWHMV